MYTWLLAHIIELIGALLGVVYIFLSIRQNIWLWPVGLASTILYVIVFFQSKLYADMFLQIYYIVVSIYGWYYWLKGGNEKDKKPHITSFAINYLPLLLIITCLIGFLLYILLKYCTDSLTPFADAFVTAGSITATWLLARKIIDNWIWWVIVDFCSSLLFAYKELWFTVGLFIIYTFMAVKGYLEWRHVMKKEQQTA